MLEGTDTSPVKNWLYLRTQPKSALRMQNYYYRNTVPLPSVGGKGRNGGSRQGSIFSKNDLNNDMAYICYLNK